MVVAYTTVNMILRLEDTLLKMRPCTLIDALLKNLLQVDPIKYTYPLNCSKETTHASHFLD